MRRRWTWPIGWLMVLLLAGASLAPIARAQDETPEAEQASPTTGGTGETITSISRDEYYRQLREAFEFEEPVNTGGQLILADISDIDSLNGLLSDDIPTAYIAGLMFESLVGVSPIDGSIVPGLADRYEVAPDGITWTFYLNEDAKWHDGEDFTAEDVAFSFDFALADNTVYAYTSTVDSAVKSYEVIDENTIQIVAEDVLVTFLYDAPGTVAIVPEHIWGEVPFDQWPNDPGNTGEDPSRVIGTGPFTFREWVEGDHVTLNGWDEYWDQEAIPNIDELIFRVLPDENTAVQALVAGEIDVLEGIPPAQVEDLEGAEGVDVRVYDTLRFNWYSPNLERAIFQDKSVRQAMLYALDRKLIAEEIYLGFAEQANGTQPVLSPAYAPDEINTVYDFDPDRARQLLEDAGWTDSDGDGTVDKDLNGDGNITVDEQLRFNFIYTEGVAIYEQMVPYMQQAWEEVGIDMLPQAVPFPTLQARLDSGDFDVALLGFSWSADATQGIMFRCDSFAPNGFNSMRYCNEEYDRLDDQQLRTFDPEARRDLLIELSNIANDDAPNGILVFRQEITGTSTRVHNFFPTGFSFLATIPFVWVEA